MGVKVGAPKSTFVNAPAGQHVGVCVDVIDKGMVEDKKFGKVQPKILIVFQLEDRMEPTPQELAEGKPGKRYSCSRKFTATLSDQGHLRPFIESMLGRRLTAEEAEEYDTDDLIGRPGLVQIMHEPGSDGTIYANITSVMALPPSVPVFTVENYVRKQDRPTDDSPAGNHEPQQTVDPSVAQLKAMQVRWNGMKSQIEEYKITNNGAAINTNLPDSYYNDFNNLKSVCDKLYPIVEAAMKALKAAGHNMQSPVKEAFDPLAAPAEEFDPLAPAKQAAVKASETVDDRAAFGDDDKTNPFKDDEEIEAEKKAAAKKAEPKSQKTAVREVHDAATVDKDPEGTATTFGQDTVQTVTGSKTNDQVRQEWETRDAGLGQIADAIISKYPDKALDGIETDEELIAAVNVFRKSKNKPLLEQSIMELKGAAAIVVANNIANGGIDLS